MIQKYVNNLNILSTASTLTMLGRKLILLSLFACLSYVANSAPLLEIVVSEGDIQGIPVAVLPFSASLEEPMVDDIAEIIHNDLRSSGQFRPLPRWDVTQQPNTRAELDFPYWVGQGVEHLILGRIEQDGSEFKISFELLDVFRNDQSADLSEIAPIITMQYHNIKADEFRALGHHISDIIFEKLIGVRGVFATRIAYVSVDRNQYNSEYQLIVADSDGHNAQVLFDSTYPIMSPAWSPNGKKLAFVSFEGNRSSVRVIDVAKGDMQVVSRFPGINGAPAWSPDGKALALALSKGGAQPKIYIANLEDNTFERLTKGFAIDTEPCWYPDAKAIAFTSNRGGRPQIYKVMLDSKKVSRVTFDGTYNARPRITPDGQHLVLMHRDDDGTFSIAVQDLVHSRFKILTKARLDESPTIAPNGMMVLYGSQIGGRGVLGAVSLDGRFKMRLPAQIGNVQEPAWSPFLSS